MLPGAVDLELPDDDGNDEDGRPRSAPLSRGGDRRGSRQVPSRKGSKKAAPSVPAPPSAEALQVLTLKKRVKALEAALNFARSAPSSELAKAKPAEVKPAEAKPAEAKPAEAKPAEVPSNFRPELASASASSPEAASTLIADVARLESEAQANLAQTEKSTGELKDAKAKAAELRQALESEKEVSSELRSELASASASTPEDASRLGTLLADVARLESEARANLAQAEKSAEELKDANAKARKS